MDHALRELLIDIYPPRGFCDLTDPDWTATLRRAAIDLAHRRKGSSGRVAAALMVGEALGYLPSDVVDLQLRALERLSGP